MADLAAALRVLQLDPCKPITPELIRKRYLKLALKLHPDRNRSSDAGEAFRRLGEAYTTALQAAAGSEATQQEAAHTQALLALFLRAMRGEDVAADLEALGAHRPPPEFGVDLGARFDARRPGGSSGSDSDDEGGSGGKPIDVAAAFRQAFQDEGLTEEVRRDMKMRECVWGVPQRVYAAAGLAPDAAASCCCCPCRATPWRTLRWGRTKR